MTGDRATLSELRFLVLDGQTTGASPRTGRLIELGWMTITGTSATATADTALLRLPEDAPLPKRVQRLTGISPQVMANAISPEAAWQRILCRAREIALQQDSRQCPVLIHYALFEKPFLKALHGACLPGADFPLEIFCTHAMALRLLADLPRKGLRSVAGYLGHTPGALKRCSEHVAATAFIWQQFLPRLQERQVHTLADLRAWLSEKGRPRNRPFVYPMPRQQRLGLPDSAGVYHFKSRDNALLYVGKSGSLRKRVNSYFQNKNRHSEDNLEMLSQAVAIDHFETATALEAALLENEHIKRFNPPYNNALTLGERRLHFISRDYARKEAFPSSQTPLGPVPNAEIFEALHLIAGYCHTTDSGSTPVDAAAFLAMPENHTPSETCFRDGLALFTSKHHGTLQGRPAISALMRIGRHSWLARKHRNDPLSEDDHECQAAVAFEWTPEAVVSYIEALSRRAGFMLRRARWLTLISEATVTWFLDSNKTIRRTLCISEGKLSQSHPQNENVASIPPGWRRRKQCLDLRTYDRLRVLTTEIRRLVAANRGVSIFLHPLGSINQEQLQRLLFWI